MSCSEPRRSVGLQPVAGDALCVTSGELVPLADTTLKVRVPSMRAELRYVTPQAAELRFRYLGPTTVMYALSSGTQRRQIGLKLHASDPCNLLYVMWRLEPVASLVVSTKRNPEYHTSHDCGARGYSNLTPTQQFPLPKVQIGSEHFLRAELTGDELRVEADGRTVWLGDVTPGVNELEGPVGVRSDNAMFEMELRVGELLHSWKPRHCAVDYEATTEP